MLRNLLVQMMLPRVRHNGRSNARLLLRRVALQQSHDSNLADVSAALEPTERALLSRMHVARFPADLRLVDLDLSAECSTVVALHRESNPMIHEPRGFLRDVNRSCQFIGADAVLAVANLPDGQQPGLQRDG